jgi:transposase
MPRFKPYDCRQSLFVPLVLEDQLSPGTLEHAIDHLIEERIAEEWFEELYRNEETGRPAYSPKLLLKVLLFGYSRGMLGSRPLEQACRENVTFMALSCGVKPDHSTIASFVGRLQGRIEIIFSEILLVCFEEGLLAGSHFALDGLKLPSNASKEWSGTFEQLRLKQQKLQRKIAEKMAEHRRHDRLERRRTAREETASCSAEKVKKEQKQKRQASLDKLRRQAERIGRFLEDNEPKEGARRKEVQSNIADNDSAKMDTSHGVIQGYNAQALVDAKAQVIVHGMASGSGQDYRHVAPVLDGAKEMLELGGLSEDLPLAGAQLSADSNFHSEENLRACEAHGVDAFIPDTHFRLRDPRFATQGRHQFKEQKNKKNLFGREDFSYDPKADCFTCPAGKMLHLEAGISISPEGNVYRRYRARATDCSGCPLRKRCLSARGATRRSLHIRSEKEPQPQTLSQRMRSKIDLPESRRTYSQRLAIVEPVFANLRSNKGMDHFTYRGKAKVNVQWLCFCLVHNLEKIAHFGASFRRKWALLRAPEGIMAHLQALYRFAGSFLTYCSSLQRTFAATNLPASIVLPSPPEKAFPTATLGVAWFRG